MSLLLAAEEYTSAVPANIAFGVMAAIMIFAAIRVVTTKNVVHAALWLVIVLAGVGSNYLLLNAEFIAMTQFLVYLGAIVVLFLFGIMLTRAPLGEDADLDNDQRGLGAAVAAILAAVLGGTLIASFGSQELTFENAAVADNVEQVSDAIFGTYLIPFEVISVLLLAALIGAIVLARKD